ncbi:MAG: hypothetical protein L0Z62_18310 [Gemmataceae bacterium]|nr:hypothetical protein [Gemmataceae bacterium]
MSPVRGGLVAVVLVTLTLTGCGTPRYVARYPEGGVIAIPDNSDCWPGYYRSKAEELMKKQCPEGYVIVGEREAVTGTVTTNRKDTDTESRDLLPTTSRFNATATTTTTRRTTETHDQTEWRIEFRKATPAVQLPPAPPPGPVQPAGYLPREPIPVAR